RNVCCLSCRNTLHTYILISRYLMSRDLPIHLGVAARRRHIQVLGQDALLNRYRAIFQPFGVRAKMKSSRFASGPVAPVATTVDVPAECVRAYAKLPFTFSSSTVKWIAMRMFLKTAS